jgi:hypothetical protein
MRISRSSLVARFFPRRVRRAIALVYSVVWIGYVWRVFRGDDGPRWLELLFLITLGLYIVIDRVARQVVEQTAPDHD